MDSVMNNHDEECDAHASVLQRNPLWTTETVFITLLTIGFGVLFLVAVVMRVAWLVDFVSFWERSCTCIRILLN